MKKRGYCYSVSCPSSVYGVIPLGNNGVTNHKVIVKELRKFLNSHNESCEFKVFRLSEEIIPITTETLIKNTTSDTQTTTGALMC